MLYFVCACVHTSAYSSYADKCNLWVHYSHRAGNMRLVSENYRNTCIVLFPMAISDIPHAHLTTARQSPNFLLHRYISNISWEMFLMSLELYFQWLSLCTCMSDFFPLFIYFLFFSLLAFCLFPLLFLISLGMTFATISESSSCLFLFFFCNVFLFPILSFFPTLKGVENLSSSEIFFPTLTLHQVYSLSQK